MLWRHLESIPLFNQEQWNRYKINSTAVSSIHYLRPTIDFTDKAIFNFTETISMDSSTAINLICQ